MAKKFEHVKNTIEEKQYQEALEKFLISNGADLPMERKEEIRRDPDKFVFWGESEDGLEVTLKQPD